MVEPTAAGLLPYSYVVGQEHLKRALELSYIAPAIGGVLISGDRGTAKSTTVRAFGVMMNDCFPVTLPINATDDRILGGWRLDELMQGRATEQIGLLEEAHERGLLYVDEVNLLDDHVVNILLDVSSTGVLSVQREGLSLEKNVEFSLVGTMNPEEGELRPQLLDRFGLAVEVVAEDEPDRRREILQAALSMDEARRKPFSDFLNRGRSKDVSHRLRLQAARERLYDVEVDYTSLSLCAAVAAAFKVAGHRGDVVLALAARALAALQGKDQVAPSQIVQMVPGALRHRRRDHGSDGSWQWTAADDDILRNVLSEQLPRTTAESVRELVPTTSH